MNQATSHVEVLNVEEKGHDTMDNERQLANEREVMSSSETQLTADHITAVSESTGSTSQEDAANKSYASIVSSQTKKRATRPNKVDVHSNTSRVDRSKTEKQSICFGAQAPAPEASAPSAPSFVNAPESRSAQDEAEGHSIYIRNLPLNMTVAQLEGEFKKFGPIKNGGVQVRSNWQQGFIYGFVEFLNLSAVHNAMQASPVTIGDHQAEVEIKKTRTRVMRGRFALERGGFRNDRSRGRGNFSSGHGYMRNDFGSHDNFSG